MAGTQLAWHGAVRAILGGVGVAEAKSDGGYQYPTLEESQIRTLEAESARLKPVLVVVESLLDSPANGNQSPVYLDYLHREGFESEVLLLQPQCNHAAEIRKRLETQSSGKNGQFRGCIWEIGRASQSVVDEIRQVCTLENAPKIVLLSREALSKEFVQAAIRAGAADVLTTPFASEDLILSLWKSFADERFSNEISTPQAKVFRIEQDPEMFGPLLIAGPRMREILDIIRRVSSHRSTVLCLGESGVGKELVCRALHQCGPRRTGPMVAVNCGAIPKTLLESELFGHARGAFTDAHEERVGLFEQAHEGTIFLDEIGDLPQSVQVQLLRVLQDGEIRPVGSVHAKNVDVRVVAATSKNLLERVRTGEFRQDLFYRINVVAINVPPLRERREEILVLANHCLEKLNRRLARKIAGLTEAARLCLVGYDWPGNVRELENTLEYASVMATDEWIDTKDLPTHVLGGPSSCSFTLSLTIDGNSLSIKRAHHAIERELIVRALEQTSGNRTHAARLLELSHRALLYKIRAFGLT